MNTQRHSADIFLAPGQVAELTDAIHARHRCMAR